MLSDLAITYLFLGGAGAGCALITSVFGLLTDKDELKAVLAFRFKSRVGNIWSRFFAAGYTCAFLLIAIGLVCLMADLGKPDAALALLLIPKASWIGFGTWALLGCTLVTGMLALIWGGMFRSTVPLLKALLWISILFDTLVIVYTGILLVDIPAVPIWNTFWLVLLFSLSSLSCGMAFFSVTSMVSGSAPYFMRVLHSIARIDAIVIFCECIALAGFVACVNMMLASPGSEVSGTTMAATESFNTMIFGDSSGWFWIGLVLIGLIFPFAMNIVLSCKPLFDVLDSTAMVKSYVMVLSALAVIAGGVIIRFLIVHVAVHPVLTLI